MRSHYEQMAYFLDLERKLSELEYHTENVNRITPSVSVLLFYLKTAKELARDLAETYKE